MEERLDILQNKIQMDWPNKTNYLRNIAINTMAANKSIDIPSDEPLVIDLIALYILCNINELKN